MLLQRRFNCSRENWKQPKWPLTIDSYKYKQFVEYLATGMIFSRKIMTTDKQNNMKKTKNNYTEERRQTKECLQYNSNYTKI